MGSKIKGVAFGGVATLLVVIAAWLAVAYSGAYNVAASDTHADPVRWTFETTMRRSVANRASGVKLRERFPEDLIVEGAGHYVESCAHCHGAPGQEPAEGSRDMRPQPPRLAEAATEWTPEQIRWIVENGLKTTGMPAFGPHHAANEIVAMTAFVTRLPGISPWTTRR